MIMEKSLFVIDDAHETTAKIVSGFKNFSQMLSYCEIHCTVKIKRECGQGHVILYEFSDKSSVELVHKFNKITDKS